MCRKKRCFCFKFWKKNEVTSSESCLSPTSHYRLPISSYRNFLTRSKHGTANVKGGLKEKNHGQVLQNSCLHHEESASGFKRGSTEFSSNMLDKSQLTGTKFRKNYAGQVRPKFKYGKLAEQPPRCASNRSSSPASDYSRSVLNSPGHTKMLHASAVASSLGSDLGTQLMSTVADDLRVIDYDIFRNFEFPFENLVFEGGGNKGMAYVGALKVLEEAGIARKIKRVCGSSVGAITATLVAVGCTSENLQEFCEGDLKEVLTDHRCGYCSLLPNLLTGFGWNPGKKLLKWFGEQLREKTGDADITFKDILHQFGRELCIVTTNLSLMSTEYFHPKTTPDTPVRIAVRMSVALPGVFQSVLYKTCADHDDVFVDGGLLCNYPIHVFDGWWLSMDPRDSFFKRLQPLDTYANLFAKNQRFGTWNPRTLGIMLYSRTETELMKAELAKRPGNQPPPPPDTKLYRQRKKMRMRQQEVRHEHEAVVSAVSRFMKELHELHFDLHGVVSLSELKGVFERAKDFSDKDKLLLFGSVDFGVAFKELDRNSDGEITFQELMAFVERRGINLQSRFLGYARREIKTFADFLSTLQTALAINVKRNYVEDRDIERTIGIDTDYIETSDFYLESEDKAFLLESGARATRAFLRDYSKKHPEHRRRASAMLSHSFDRLRLGSDCQGHSIQASNGGSLIMQSQSDGISYETALVGNGAIADHRLKQSEDGREATRTCKSSLHVQVLEAGACQWSTQESNSTLAAAQAPVA